jgi:hypothetical protein
MTKKLPPGKTPGGEHRSSDNLNRLTSIDWCCPDSKAYRANKQCRSRRPAKKLGHLSHFPRELTASTSDSKLWSRQSCHRAVETVSRPFLWSNPILGRFDGQQPVLVLFGSECCIRAPLLEAAGRGEPPSSMPPEA